MDILELKLESIRLEITASGFDMKSDSCIHIYLPLLGVDYWFSSVKENHIVEHVSSHAYVYSFLLMRCRLSKLYRNLDVSRYYLVFRYI
jgi:hypothetical protein